MSNTLIQEAGAFLAGLGVNVDAVATATTPAAVAPGAVAASRDSDAPVGYRWVSKRWRVLPNGKRDYAAFHGKTAFSYLLPVSSRLHTRER